MMPEKAREYLLAALAGTPEVLERLLAGVHAEDRRWDFRPDSSRFTLREAVAHLADWEPIHVERLCRLRDETDPSLPDVDEGEVAIENDYAHSDPHGSLEWMRAGRQQLLHALETLPADAWTRPGLREGVGHITIESFVAMIAGHDGYHLRQVAQWLTLADLALPEEG
ncbi:MAG TPA: DinB family protein [Chthonomonadaceae bacterium]|nr:DinB family protein [Chthonomonadaceae bacterium]